MIEYNMELYLDSFDIDIKEPTG